MAFTDDVNYFTGTNKGGGGIDPLTMEEPTGQDAIDYYNQNPEQAYYRNLYRRYGALNNLGDRQRSYLMNNASRATQGFDMAKMLPSSDQYSQAAAPNAYNFFKQGVDHGATFDTRAYQTGFNRLLDAVERAGQGGAPGANASTQEKALYNWSQGQGLDDLYGYGVLSMASSPLQRWMSNNFNRQSLLSQMPGYDSFANYLRGLFGRPGGSTY